ncbi:hypothetical protein DAPPUDRAFT_308977 [Daphnia pulex]|uniref:L-dopachrome isomerase n=1 Tax=Daphnia pulex TaxID=6669 RepID=E9G3A6_DAPPU|nr:hypothetical protein DAPPUDRAFT_308977 [Daphnia pulex]|eukprot:EFX85741.1 hypothetical protein DAPPUDRAFT_308977 [Daphnia pulex]
MPHLKITTNVSKSSIPNNFLKETSALIAKMLGKPESYCVVTVVPDQMMIWGGEEGPCAIAHLMSIGKLGVNENKSYSKILGEYVEKHLGVAPNHMYIEYQDVKTADLGYDKTTFHDILG